MSAHKKVDTISEVYDLAAKAKSELERRNRRLLSNHQKDLRFFTQSEAMEFLNCIDRETLLEHCAKLGLDPRNKNPTAKWLVDINEIYALRTSIRNELPDWFPPVFERSPLQEAHIVAFGNQKGGSGKTTSVVTFASWLAAQLHEEFRVIIVDLDAQGTSSMYYAPERNLPKFDNVLSVGDFLKGAHIPRLQAGESMKEIVKSSLVDTTIPNLKLITAKESDRDAEHILARRAINGEVKNPYGILSDVFDAIKDEADIILIDTPPRIDHVVINGLYAASSLIVCVSPTENDIDATFNWHTHLPTIFELIDDYGFEGYDNEIKHLFTNVDGKHTSTQEMKYFERVFGTSVLPAYTENSEAIKYCAAQKNTIFDISKSDYTIPDKTRTYKKPFEKALTNNQHVGTAILKLITDVWNKQDKAE